MKRFGVFYKLKPGKREAYIKRHEEIWPEISELLDLAGFRNYSIWNEGDFLFGYYECKDSERAEKLLAGNPVYGKWRDEMEEYIYMDPQTKQKEWFMKCVFFHE